MMEPRFSVIIPTYNNGGTLARAVRSVLDQTWSAHEIIVVDDASSEDVQAVLAPFEDRVRYLRLPVNQGVSAARNLGATEARGDWLAFLDADDWYLPERLQAHAEWIQEDPELDFLTGDYEYRDEKGTLLGFSMDKHEAGRKLKDRVGDDARAVMDDADFEAFVADHFGDTHTLSVPRKNFLKLNGYPVGFRVCEDVHLLVRIVAMSRRAGVVCRPLAVYLIHASSATRRDPVSAQYENVRTLRDLASRTPEFPRPVRRGLCKRLREARYNLGSALVREHQHLRAISVVLPSLYESPGWSSLRNLLSMLKG